jgi:iron complex outermembrane receptor protein
LAGRVGFSLTPDEDRSSLLTAFAQDEIALFGNRLAVTLGSQVQYDTDSGPGVQPTARAMWNALPHQRLWGATSRALRTPSLSERGLRLDYPPVRSASGLPLYVTVLGNPAVETETLVDVEAGYRLEIGTAASIDVTAFRGSYDYLRTQELQAPVVRFVPSPRILVTSLFGNQLAATTRGVELAGHWAPIPAWRFDGSFTGFHLTPQLAPGSQDPAAASEDGSTPRTQWQVRAAFSPAARATFNVATFYVGEIEQVHVDAYSRVDVSAEWRFTASLSATAIGQNLLDPAHAESSGAGSLLVVTQVPRGLNLRVRWTF